MTPRYFSAMQRAYVQREQREWERARLIGYLAVMPHVNAKKTRLTPQRLLPFAWDHETGALPKAKPVTREFQEAADKIFAKYYGNNKRS